MDCQDASSTEDVSSWEMIESPNSEHRQSQTESGNPDPATAPASPPTQTGKHELGNTMVRDEVIDERLVFPPSHHEGLQITKQKQPSSSTPTSSSASSEQKVRSGPHVPIGGEIKRRMMDYVCNLSRRVAASTFCSFVFCRAKIWSLTLVCASVAVFAASSAYAKVLQRRKMIQEQNGNLLRNIIKEKDQKINLLLTQIAVMNEKLAAKRRVPVVRIG